MASNDSHPMQFLQVDIKMAAGIDTKHGNGDIKTLIQGDTHTDMSEVQQREYYRGFGCAQVQANQIK